MNDNGQDCVAAFSEGGCDIDAGAPEVVSVARMQPDAGTLWPRA